MKQLIIFLSLITIISCTTKRTNYDNYQLSQLLNDCDCYGVVIASSHNKGYIKTHQNFLLIEDRLSVVRTYQGSNFNLKVGDTIIKKLNCKRIIKSHFIN